MEQLISTLNEAELLRQLKIFYKESRPLSDTDRALLKNYPTQSYLLFGIIGLLTEDLPRILLGLKQTIDMEIHHWCKQIDINEDVLIEIADQFLEDEFANEIEELVLRNVMLEYPKQR